MAKVKIKLNRSGVRALLRSKEMKNVCEEHAKAIARRCGEGYATSTHIGPTRCNASVYPDSSEAAIDNSDNQTILKAVR